MSNMETERRIVNNFGESVRRNRKDIGLSQKNLAKSLEPPISATTVSKMESGKRFMTPDKAVNLMNAVRVPRIERPAFLLEAAGYPQEIIDRTIDDLLIAVCGPYQDPEEPTSHDINPQTYTD